MKTNLSAILGRPWVMRDDCYAKMASVLNNIHEVKLGEEPPAQGMLWCAGGKARTQRSVGILPIYGMIDQRPSWMMAVMGGTPTDYAAVALDSMLADPSIKGIVLDVDSPGGTALGVQTLSDKIYAGRSVKPIVAVSNSEASSAAYWIASAASKLFVAPGASAGSIGVWSAMVDETEALKSEGISVRVIRSTESPFKAEGLSFESPTNEAIENEQNEVNLLYDVFAGAVARNRGVSVSEVRKNYGKGRVMSDKAAVAAGLADRVATFEDVVRRMDSGRLSLNNLNQPLAMDSAFADELPEDESWRDFNASERLRSRLRLAGRI